LKQDTLINVCGGYTFFMVKEGIKKKSK